ncbi:phosphodiesterase [Boudabousia liubingyangii]|uniref:sulfatase-like hydrolase/transferase n=1 Tax=Boudabousia liubingyangii TaxID=1921764 RepID=UPI00093EB94C|nr:sulfatase-like hydrolase/transferase [Boudabousia liubingyangii]OKL48420.1 phosphodiesterase [Boudabousia liubingyangii]
MNTRPNFLVVMTDDQGPWALPQYTPELMMPNLVNLMQQSTEFTQFYCASPVCSPARASLLTGRMPSAHGVLDWLFGERYEGAFEDLYLEGLHTTPELLGNSGYQCGMSGKWHVGSSQEKAPGFDFWYAHRIGGGPYYNAPIWDVNGRKAKEPRYFTDAVTEEADNFLRTRTSQQPFYLQVNYTAPHDPWLNGNHPQDLLDLYAGQDFPSIPRLEPHPWVHPRRDDFEGAFKDPIPRIQGYFAALSGVDRGLGKLLQTLEDTGQADNTVVIFMADNGYSLGHHGFWGKGNGTYPMNFWECSVKVPFIIHLPGQTQSQKVEHPVSATSLHPTLCALAGVEVPEDPLAAGSNFAPLLQAEGVRADLLASSPESAGAEGYLPEPRVPAVTAALGANDERDGAVFIYEEYGGGRMVAQGPWKLVDRYRGPRELYNLEADPDEQHNLIGDAGYQVVESELVGLLHDWFKGHETEELSGFHRRVYGRGQYHPLWRQLSDEETFKPHPDMTDIV